MFAIRRMSLAPMSIGALVLFCFSAPRPMKAGSCESRVSIQTRARQIPRSDISVDSRLVLIPVSVTDPRNRPVMGLASDSFRVFEGKSEQKVVRLSSEEVPLSVGIVFDASGSMKGKLAKAREAVREFLKSANPEDEFFLVNFSREPELAVPFTSNPGDIQLHVMYESGQGRTALLDAVNLALHYMKGAHNPHRALLVISDGGDNHSRYTETEMLRIVQESDVSIYALGIYARSMDILPEEERGGEKLLKNLTAQSGGRHFGLEKADDLPAAATAIGLELRNQYLLAYRPADTGFDGKYHRVEVRLVEGNHLRLSWRPGYYAPGR